MTIKKLLWCIGASLMASTATSVAQPSQPPANTARCPLAEANVKATNVPGGAALVFTTRDDVGALRSQVRQMAAMRNRMNQRMGAGPGATARGGTGGGMHHGGMHGGGRMMGHGAGMMSMVPSRATVEDVPGGARLVFKPTDPDQLDTLRSQVRENAEAMRNADCPATSASPDR